MPSFIKSILLVLLGAVLASLAWMFWTASVLEQVAEEVKRNDELNIAASGKAQLAALAGQLAMDILALNSSPDDAYCMIWSHAELKYHQLAAHRSSVESYAIVTINDFEELSKDGKCAKQ